MDLARYATAIRLRILRPLVAARGAVLRRIRPPTRAEAAADRDDRPILLVGCHRSGTSLVRRIVNSHPRIGCPAETVFLEALGALIEHPQAAEGFAALAVPLDDAARALGAQAEAWFRAWARAQGKHRWADKSPGNTWHLEGIDRLFGHRPQYVCIVRDGRDVAVSLGNARPVFPHLQPWLRDTPDPVLAAARYWVDVNERMLAFRAAHPERCHVLRYEALVATPEPTVRALFAFLGEPFDPAVLDFNRQRHSGGLEDHHVSTTTTFEDHTGRHRELSPATRDAVQAIVRDTMARLSDAGAAP